MSWAGERRRSLGAELPAGDAPGCAGRSSPGVRASAPDFSTAPRPPLGRCPAEAPPPEPALASEWLRCPSVCSRGGVTDGSPRCRAAAAGKRAGRPAVAWRRVHAGGGAQPAWRRRGARRGSGSALRPPQVGAGMGTVPEGVVAAREGERNSGCTSRVAVRGLHLSLREPERGGSVCKDPGAWTCWWVSSGRTNFVVN